jgi:hypothetical protein
MTMKKSDHFSANGIKRIMALTLAFSATENSGFSITFYSICQKKRRKEKKEHFNMVVKLINLESLCLIYKSVSLLLINSE